MKKTLLYSSFLLIALSVIPFTASAASKTFTPLEAASYYVDGKTAFGLIKGPTRSTITQMWQTGNDAVLNRALSVKAATALNGDLTGSESGYTTGKGAFPPVFGGFTVFVENTTAPIKLTTRTEFVDGKDDFDSIRYLLYNESPTDTEAALTYQFSAAWLIAASPSGPIELASIAEVTFSGRSAPTTRVIVHDAMKDAFYVSEATTTGPDQSIDISKTNWAKVTTSNLAEVGAFAPQSISTIDYIGIYVETGTQEAGPALPPYKHITSLSISGLSFTTKQ